MTTVKFSEHPDYRENKQDWKDWRNLYEGKHSELTSSRYLWPHEFEDTESGRKLREIREERSRYVNFFKPIVRRYVSLMFSNEIDRKVLLPIFGEEWIEDVDGYGTNFENFARRVAENYFLYGKPIVIVDADNRNAQTRGEEVLQGRRPFLQLWNPLAMPDWQIETADPARAGKYNALRLEYVVTEDRKSLTDAPEQRKYSRILKVDGSNYVVELYRGPKIGEQVNGDDVAWELQEIIPVDLNEIPIASVVAPSWMDDIAPVALLRYNTHSALNNINLFQAHQRIVYAGPLLAEGESIVMNEASVTKLPEGAVVTIVDPADPVSLRTELDTLSRDMYRIAFQQDRTLPSDSRQVQGADTIKEGKEELLASLKVAGKEIGALLDQAVSHFAAYASKSYSGTFKLNLDLSTDNLDEQMTATRQHWDEISKYPEWRKEVNRKIALSQDLQNIKSVLKEIETKKPEDEQAANRVLDRRALFEKAAGLGNAR